MGRFETGDWTLTTLREKLIKNGGWTGKRACKSVEQEENHEYQVMTETGHVHQKLSFREKAGYSLGDIATNFFFMSMLIYQSRFYTDTMGLSPVAVGWMFILVRWADAFFDPLVGALSDRTKTRWGKFRPWVLFTAVPFPLAFWAIYTTPHFGPTGKLIYAYITYVLAMALYSANNTPYSALSAVMTPDDRER
jgi:Na+/melibiose symporter-like transporter